MAEDDKGRRRSFMATPSSIENLLHDAFRSAMASCFSETSTWSPPVDVFETEDSYIVKAEIAGIPSEDVRVTFHDGHLTIEGCRHDTCSSRRVSCRQMEIPYGHFRRTLFIGRDVSGDDVSARYAEGFLEVLLPRSRGEMRKQVDIRVE